MNLKTYTAPTMAEALAQVKRELGKDAVILHTRSYKQGGVLGLGAKAMVEITASRAADVGQARHVKRPSGSTGSVPSRNNGSRLADGSLAGQRKPGTGANGRAVGQGVQPTAGDLIRRTYAVAKRELEQEKAAAAPKMPGPAAPQQQRASNVVQPASPNTAQPTTASSADSSMNAAENEQLAEEMRFVRQMMGKMMRGQNRRTAKNQLTGELFDQYMNLLKHEVAEELAEEVVQQVQSRLSDDELEDENKVRLAMRDALAEHIPIDGASHQLKPTEDGRPRTIALIGPTGVGKTTTVAKLAATFKLKHNKKVGLITIDTYRIAAVEQLKTYANIIKVPLQVVTSPEEMTNAVRKYANCEVILIDTAGRSQRDDPKLDQLAEFIKAAQPHETHLVLSSTASQSVMLEIVRKFGRLRADRIIFTKLDEAVSFGVLLNVARRVKKQLSFLTTGQEVPHQIEPSRKDRLAALVMGETDL